MSNQTLTEQDHRDLLAYIYHCQQRDGYSPTIAETAGHFYLSKTAVSYRLNLLVLYGLLIRADGKARALKLTDAGMAVIEETDAEQGRRS